MKQADFEKAAQLQTQMKMLKAEKDKLHRHSDSARKIHISITMEDLT